MQTFKNFNPHTDLTNPQAFLNMNSFTPSHEQLAEYSRTYGKIKDLFGFYVEFTGSEFILTDDYANQLYIALSKEKEKVFELINSFDFQVCSSLKEFDILIRKTFKRKPSNLA